MRQHEESREAVEKTVRDIKRKTRRHFGAEEKIRIVLQGLRGTRVSMNLGTSCRQVGGRLFSDAEIDECHRFADEHLTSLITTKMANIQIPEMLYVTLTVSREGEPDAPPKWTAREDTASFLPALSTTLAATKRLIGQCPYCTKRFVGSKQGQQFCQRTCANRYSVRRWRQEQQRGAHNAPKTQK